MSGHPRAPPAPLQPPRGWRGGGAVLCGWGRTAAGWEWEGAKQHQREGRGERRGRPAEEEFGKSPFLKPTRGRSDTACVSSHLTLPSQSLITAVPHIPLQERNSRSISGAVGDAPPGLPFLTARLMLCTRRFIGGPCPQGQVSVPRAAPHTQTLNWQRPPGQGTAGSTAWAGSACRRCSLQCPPSDQTQRFPLIQCIFSTLLS